MYYPAMMQKYRKELKEKIGDLYTALFLRDLLTIVPEDDSRWIIRTATLANDLEISAVRLESHIKRLQRAGLAEPLLVIDREAIDALLTEFEKNNDTDDPTDEKDFPEDSEEDPDVEALKSLRAHLIWDAH